MQKNKCFFMVKNAKQKFLLENCKCLFKKEKIVLKLFAAGSSPLPLTTDLVSYKLILTNL